MFSSFLAATTTSSGSGGLVAFAPLLLMGLVGYFLLIRPQQRRSRAQQALQRSIEEGDEVLTTAGIYATVIDIDEDAGTVVLEIAPGTHVTVVRGAIAQRITEDGYDQDDDDQAEDDDDEAAPTQDGAHSGFLADAKGDDAAK